MDNGNDLSVDNDMYFRVRIFAFGTVAWMPFLRWVTACDLDLTYFPLDQQSCNVVLMRWMFNDTSVVNVTVIPNFNGSLVDTSDYIKSSGWDLITTGFRQYMSPGRTPLFEFNFVLQRVSTYYILNVIIPVVCLSVLSAMVFRMPAEAGEKMGLSVTVLMSYSVILMIMSDNVPRSSKLPIISKKFMV